MEINRGHIRKWYKQRVRSGELQRIPEERIPVQNGGIESQRAVSSMAFLRRPLFLVNIEENLDIWVT